MTIYFNFLSAKKSADAKDAVILVDVETAKECPFAISFLAKQNGIDLSNYFKPVTTDTPIVDDLPEENEFSTTWCEKYELADDKKTWRLIAAPEPAPETNLTAQNDSSDVLTIVSAMPQLESRVASLFLLGVDALRAQRALTELQPRTEITFHYREYRKTEQQQVRFVFQPREVNNEKKPHYCSSTIATLWDTAIKRSKVRRRTPYHTRHTYACWLLSAGANPAFIASQMGHENSKMVFEVYGTWIEEMNNEQVKALNTKLAI